MRFRQWLARKILPRAKQVHTWAAMELIDDPDSVYCMRDAGDRANLTILPDHMHEMARGIVETELDQILVTARVAAFNRSTEEEIIHKRLARRYDPGMALNEAFARAAEKVEEEKPIHPVSGEPVFYTAQQKAALKFQEEFLRKNAARAPRPLGE